MAIILKKKVVERPRDVDPTGVGPRTPAGCENFDGVAQTVVKGRQAREAAVSWWLIASYLHCAHGMTVLSEGYRRELAKLIDVEWDQITTPNRALVHRAALKEGAFTNLAEGAYPAGTRAAAQHIVKGFWGISIKVS